MSIYETVVSWLSSTPAKLDKGNDGRWHDGGGPTFAKKSVTADSTLTLSAAWACVRLNARTIGSLPIKVFERRDTVDRMPAENHPLYRVLAVSPNADQTAMEYWEGQVTALNLRGNAYSRIARRGDGQVVALWPISPDNCSPYRTGSGERRYRGWLAGQSFDLASTEIFHLRGFGAGGDMGLSPIAYGRQTIATSLATEEVAGSTFASGLQVAGFVELATGTKLTAEQRREVVELFERFAGSAQTGKVMPLDPGMKFAPLKMTAADAQLLESRRFSIEELCRWFGAFPILIGHSADGQTMWGSGIEQIVLAWLTLGLGTELVRIKQAIEKQLLLPAEQGRVYVEHVVEGLLRADSAARAALYASMGQNGVMRRNEMRAKENLPRDPSAGADMLTVQSNLIPLDKLGSADLAPADQARSALLNLLFGGDPNDAIAQAVKAEIDRRIAA